MASAAPSASKMAMAVCFAEFEIAVQNSVDGVTIAMSALVETQKELRELQDALVMLPE